jgi:chemotaxis protein CheY-P-specific phosphatase CheC
MSEPTRTGASPPKAVDWIAEVARSAERAAPAFEQLLGRPFSPATPAFARPGASVRARAESGIFFELEGDAAGWIALISGSQSPRAGATAESADAIEQSLALELANIAASQVVSGLADAIRGRILLSLPSFVAQRADRELARRWEPLRARPGLLALEVAFRDGAGEAEYRVVLVAELTADPGL